MTFLVIKSMEIYYTQFPSHYSSA